MFECFDPREGKILSLLDETGTLTKAPDGWAVMDDEQALAGYRHMVRARQADEWAVNLNRQGRMPTYVLCKGQEANAVGALMAMRQDDWFVPAYRELGAMIVRGVGLTQIYRYWHGSEEGSRLPPETFHMMPIAVPVGSQVLHAVGIAYAERYRKSDRIAIGFMGDGASSEGDFHEAANMAGVWKAGVVIFAQNNQWAISTPWNKQSASPTVAEKAFAYGFEGIRVDGNDLFAVYTAVSMAARKARAGDGPTLVEGLTYRMGAHTTSDDPSRYRSADETMNWQRRDPILRLELYLSRKGLLAAEEPRALREAALAEARAAFEEAEREGETAVEETFSYLYADMPDLLALQMQRRME
ncbi:MAG TPA: pyruvate dehydrogenase (acetyl-transferring) E1 component subunit alpha [Spirochaetia bacterium]|nr:pyruvate dehydrogenase (acetyl-transferring) E1 component subunit alpha [Spirochaetia bacterium]